MKEEDFIRERCGTKNPFRVPEGYFENFTADLMDKLPERERTILSSANRPHHVFHFAWYAAAVLICGLIFSGIQYFTPQHSSSEISAYNMPNNNLDDNRDNDIDEYLDYAMMSNQEIAQYLTEAY